MEPIYNLTCVSLNSQPWLEPYDSSARLDYYIFENNKRLTYNHMSFPPPSPLMYENFATLANESDMVLMPIPPNDRVMEDYNASISVPFMYSYNIILSIKNVTVTEDAPGPFKEMLRISGGVWMSLVAIFILLAMVAILEERMNGIKRATLGHFADKIYNYYQALLGQSIPVPSWPAIRISHGIWLLELIVFINLFSGFMKTNYTARTKKNINSIEDIFKRPDLYISISRDNEIEICDMKNEKFTKLCERRNEIKIRVNYTDSEVLDAIIEGKAVWIGDFAYSLIFMENFEFIFKNVLRMSSHRYLTKPLIFHVSKNINPEALKLVNKRLRSYFETSQFVLWHRRMEKIMEMDLEPSPYTRTTANYKPIRLQDIKSVFNLWIVILIFSPILEFLERVIK